MVVTLLFLSPAISADEASPPRVADGSFESTAANPRLGAWVLRGSGGIDTGESQVGGAAARLEGPQRFESEWVQTLGRRLEAGGEYVLTAWVKAERDDAIAALGLRWEGGFPRLYRGLRAADGWQPIEIAFTVPTPAPAWIQVVLSGEHEGSLWWDNVHLTEAHVLRERMAREWEPRLASGESIYTGLVVNVQGLGIERGMSPKVYDTDGRMVYSGTEATGEQLIGRGIVSYVRIMEEAVTHPRLHVHEDYPLRHPLVIDAIDGRDRPRTGAVISAADAEHVLRALREYDFLGRFAVVFLVD